MSEKKIEQVLRNAPLKINCQLGHKQNDLSVICFQCWILQIESLYSQPDAPKECIGCKVTDCEDIEEKDCALSQVTSTTQDNLLLSDEENYKFRYGKLPDDDNEDMEVYLRGKCNFSYYELKQFQKAQLAKAEPLIRADERAKVYREIGEWLEINSIWGLVPIINARKKSMRCILEDDYDKAIANLKAGKPLEEKK